MRLPGFGDAPFTFAIPEIAFTHHARWIDRGQINVAVPRAELGKIIPIAARLLAGDWNQRPQNPQVLSLFDNGGANEGCMGGCKNDDGSCGRAQNQTYEPCEILTNSIVKNLVATDLDLDDEPGRDAMTLGVGFTAVPVP
jgi:hypothetical protein